jgi:hypothetical protein
MWLSSFRPFRILRPDGLHYEGAGADIISRWLLQQLHFATVH